MSPKLEEKAERFYPTYHKYVTTHVGMSYLIGGKNFVCKGKHQYRKTNGVWICQCGKTLKN
jgi:hypothetical protein